MLVGNLVEVARRHYPYVQQEIDRVQIYRTDWEYEEPNTFYDVNELAVFLINDIYDWLYDDVIDESEEVIIKAEEWISAHPNETAELCRVRGDIFSSDRELNALGLALDL